MFSTTRAARVSIGRQRIRQHPRGLGNVPRLAPMETVLTTLVRFSSFALISKKTIDQWPTKYLQGQRRGSGDQPCSSPSSVVDPHNLIERFISTHEQHFETALSEIRAGSKSSHWSWFIFPTPPYDQGSALNQYYALRTAEQARAFLQFPTTNGVNLRDNYMTIMEAVADQLESNKELTVGELVGGADAPKLESSLTYFEYISRTTEPPDLAVNTVCQRALKMLKNADKRPGPFRRLISRWVKQFLT